MVHNCRAEISPRPVSQDVHLAPRFIFIVLTTWLTPYRFYASASSLFVSEEIKSRTDDKQPISVSVIVCALIRCKS